MSEAPFTPMSAEELFKARRSLECLRSSANADQRALAEDVIERCEAAFSALGSVRAENATALAERIERARNALSRIHVKTRDVGECVLCRGRTSSGMDKLCTRCADAELRDVASAIKR